MSGWLRDLLLTVDGVYEAPSRFKDDLAYWVDRTEIAHFESETALDLRLTRAVIREVRARLRADPRVHLRPNSADWVTVDAAGPQDSAFVRDLVERAAAAHRPAAR
jgi:hypothetical protein